MIPTRDRAALLSKALVSVLLQTFPQEKFEVIVVDNGSSDNTKDICEKFAQNIQYFQYVYDERPGLHVGRHVGLKVSKGDILVYADDDIRAFPTWLEGIAEMFVDTKVALVGGKNLPDFEVDPPEWVMQMWESHNGRRMIPIYSVLDFGDEIQEISPKYIWGCNFSIRKSVLLKVGGFHPDGMPKDKLEYRGDGETFVSESVEELGYKTVYCPKASVFHWVSAERMTLSYVRNRGFAQGVSYSYSKIRKLCRVPIIDWQHNIKMSLKTIRRLTVNKVMGNDTVVKAYEDGYKAGYNFHRVSIKKDPRLLKWVLKESYLD